MLDFLFLWRMVAFLLCKLDASLNLAIKMQEVILLPQSHLLDEPCIRNCPKGAENEQKQVMFFSTDFKNYKADFGGDLIDYQNSPLIKWFLSFNP